jgi:hypothetical protein
MDKVGERFQTSVGRSIDGGAGVDSRNGRSRTGRGQGEEGNRMVEVLQGREASWLGKRCYCTMLAKWDIMVTVGGGVAVGLARSHVDRGAEEGPELGGGAGPGGRGGHRECIKVEERSLWLREGGDWCTEHGLQ